MSDRERIIDLEVAVAKLISEVGRLWKHMEIISRRVPCPDCAGTGCFPDKTACTSCLGTGELPKGVPGVQAAAAGAVAEAADNLGIGGEVPAAEARTLADAALGAAAAHLARRCICGPDSTGESPDCRPDCPVHGANAPYDPAESNIGEVPF